MSATPLYIYGIMRGPGTIPAGEGIGGAPMHLHAHGNLAALVSSGVEQPVPRMRRHLLVHAKVLEQTMANCTVLPIRFGTMVPGGAALSHCLQRYQAEFLAGLNDIDGQVEMGVKACWRENAIYADIIEQDKGLRQMRDQLRSRTANETYYERIELGRRVEAALAERGSACAAAISAALSPLVVRETELPTQEDSMILNRALLLKNTREAEFDAAIASIADRFGEKLRLRYVGPVPPFNFVSMYATWLDGAQA